MLVSSHCMHLVYQYTQVIQEQTYYEYTLRGPKVGGGLRSLG